MKKVLMAIALAAGMVMSLTGCEKKVTLNLSYGERTGVYDGDMVDGVPHGQGVFTAKNDAGESWTYEGSFKNGHFEGQGKTTWENGQIEMGTYQNDVLIPLTGDQVKTLYGNPEKFKYHYVEIIAQVNQPGTAMDGGTIFDIISDGDYSKDAVVYLENETIEVEEKDYVKIVGLVTDNPREDDFSHMSSTGLYIKAKTCEVMTYIDAVSPTLKEVKVDQTQDQFGYSITIEKIEFAEKETRVYVSEKNNGTDKFYGSQYNFVVSQSGKQYEYQYNYDAEYPELQNELMVGNSTEGIIAYPPLDPDQDLTITVDAFSGNYKEDFVDYVFEI